MKYLILPLFLLLAFSFSACDFPSILSGNESSQKPRRNDIGENILDVSITGGIAGINDRVEVSASGRATYVSSFQSGATWTIQLSQDELNSLTNLMQDNHFFELDSQYVDPQVADAFFYKISFMYGNRSKSVLTDYFGAPDNLKRIVDGLNSLKTQITDNAPKLELSLSRSVIHSGEDVEMNLTVTNTRDATLTLEFSSGQIFDFFAKQIDVISGDSTLVWNWAHDKAFTQVIWKMTLEPGQTKSFDVVWNGKSNAGSLVTGGFIMGARLVSIPGGSPPQKQLTIHE